MIQLVLIDKDLRNLERILVSLMERKLILNPSIGEELKYQPVQNGNFLKLKQYRLTAISRAILNKEIINCIEEVSSSNGLEFYTIPVVDMDWKQSNDIKGYFEDVKLVS